MRLPDFIIVGAMKCATSTIHEQLARQRGFFMSVPKEPNFFSDDDVFARGLQWYSSLFDRALRSDLCGESSTHYTKRPTHPRTVERIAAALGQHVRFVYVIRHPIDRLVSQYIHEWSQRRVSCSIDEAIDRHPELISYSRYAMQIEPFLSQFGPRRVALLTFEGIRAHPEAEFRRLGEFLGAPHGPVWDRGVAASNVSRDRLRLGPIREALIRSPLLTSLRRRLVPQSWRDRIKRQWTMAERPVLSVASVSRLTEIFDADLARLHSWLGLSLSCTNYLEQIERIHQPGTTGALEPAT